MAAHNEPIAQPAQAFASGNDYGALVYARTATVLETLSGAYGDAALKRALGRYTRRYRFEHPTLEQFTDVMREVLGEGAHQALRSALFERGWVDYLVTNAVSKPDDGAAGVFDCDGKRETVVRASGSSSTFRGYALVVRRGTLHWPGRHRAHRRRWQRAAHHLGRRRRLGAGPRPGRASSCRSWSIPRSSSPSIRICSTTACGWGLHGAPFVLGNASPTPRSSDCRGSCRERAKIHLPDSPSHSADRFPRWS